MEQAGFSWGPGQAPPQELSSMSEELYKQAKENFVAGKSGGSLSEVMALMMVNAVGEVPALSNFRATTAFACAVKRNVRACAVFFLEC